MIAVALTLLIAVYIYGPDAFSRFLLDFSVPRRAVTLTKTEEIQRAVVWSGTSVLVAVYWARWQHALYAVWDTEAIRVFFSGLYSEKFFEDNRNSWFTSAAAVARMNWCLLWRLYAVIAGISMVLIVLVHFYSRIRRLLPESSLWGRLGRRVLEEMVLPRVAPWHLLLSNILIDRGGLRIHVDVLTKMDVLYQGKLAAKALSTDGSLMSMTLEEPRRFKRDEYLADKTAGHLKDVRSYWRTIPTNMFVIMGAEIHTINLRYKPDYLASLRRPNDPGDFEEQLRAIRTAVDRLKRSTSVIPPSVRLIDDEIPEQG